MPLAAPLCTWNEQVKTIRLRTGAISRMNDHSNQLQMVLFRRAAELNTLLAICPEEERRGLSPGAVQVGAEGGLRMLLVVTVRAGAIMSFIRLPEEWLRNQQVGGVIVIEGRDTVLYTRRK